MAYDPKFPFQFPPLPVYLPPAPTPPPPSQQKLIFLPFYIGILLISLVIGLCKLIVFSYSSQNEGQELLQNPSQTVELSYVRKYSTFKYSKSEMQGEVVDIDNECSICLSVFEDGQDIRQLPRCKHSFHAPCIDMWLHSHPECPLCRGKIGQAVSPKLV